MNLGLVNVFLPLLTFGMAVAFLGTIKLSLAERLTLNDARMANFIILAPLSNLIGTLIAGYWLVGMSYQLVIVGGYLLIINALILFAQVKNTYLLIPAIISLGLGGGWLNLGSNALLAVLVPKNPASITNLSHACFGLGALILPIILSYFLRRFPWQYAISLVALLIILPTLPALFMTYPPSAGSMIGEIDINSLFNPIMRVALLAALCYVGVEASIAIWTTTYLKHIGWEELTASSLVSLFWLGLMGGRILTGLMITTDNSDLVLQGTISILLITFIIMTLFLRQWFGVVSVIVLGVSCAAIFPTLIGWLFTQFDPRLSGTIYALMSASGMTGSSIFPYLVGNVSNRFSIIRGFQLLLIPTSCLLVLSLVI